MKKLCKERQRLSKEAEQPGTWSKWGPYLSERQWGTVREDYSADGNAWDYFPHDHARSRAYRWGEDGIAGLSDDTQRLCLSLALWNGHDSILKERLFGLSNREGNHGEDVKEIYYYLDAVPSHSYLKMLYKYPQRAFPYAQLVAENRDRDKRQPEFELLDTGVFEDDRYFDVFVEYAKAGPEDLLMRVTVCNRGPEAAEIHVLPQLCFRNTWAWGHKSEKPSMAAADSVVAINHSELGDFELHCAGAPELLFCDNETNERRLFGQSNPQGHVKDAFHEHVIRGQLAAVNPRQTGSKAAAHYRFTVPAGQSVQTQLRLTRPGASKPFADFDDVFARRLREADEFYGDIQQGIAGADARDVQRQAFAGMIWSKQFYNYDVSDWLEGDRRHPSPPGRERGRNSEWAHLSNADIISMPDKWEYPWYAAWDLAFHCIPLALIDAEFAKNQLVLFTRERYMHPSGQLPAYEWAFGDVNPPVHAWAAWRVFQIDRKQRRRHSPDDPGDLRFLERIFHKLLLNFTWWVNRKDMHGHNVFQGGFLGGRMSVL